MMGQVVEAAATPLAGLESDRITGCGKYGRRKVGGMLNEIMKCMQMSFFTFSNF